MQYLWREVGKGCILHRVSEYPEPTLAGPGRRVWEAGSITASLLHSKSILCWFVKAPIKHEYNSLETSASNTDWKCDQRALFIQSHRIHLWSPFSALGCDLWFLYLI